MKEKLQKLQDYFLKYLNFESLNGEELWIDDNIEYELHLFNQERTVYIDIAKYKDKNEPEFTMRGNVQLGNSIQPYIKYFLGYSEYELTPQLKDLFSKIDKQLESNQQN